MYLGHRSRRLKDILSRYLSNIGDCPFQNGDAVLIIPGTGCDGPKSLVLDELTAGRGER